MGDTDANSAPNEFQSVDATEADSKSYQLESVCSKAGVKWVLTRRRLTLSRRGHESCWSLRIVTITEVLLLGQDCYECLNR